MSILVLKFGGTSVGSVDLIKSAAQIIKKEYGLEITEKQLKESLNKAFNPARYQTISKKPILIVDVSHNLHSIKSLIVNFFQI